jgi:hypothetical protein
MSRRIDIEITSLTAESATWRAAGAKQPKGVVSLSLLPTGVSVGAVYRAEIEQDMVGVEVLSVTAPKTASPLDPRKERLELLAPERKGPDIEVTYAPKGRGRGGSRPDRGSDDGDRKPRSEGARKPRREGERTARPDGTRPSRPAGAKGDGERRSSPRGDRAPRGPRPPLGLAQVTTHRNAFLASLSAEQIPVAEQILRGGMQAVRAAVDEQNKTAQAQGRPTIDAGVITAIADGLLSRANLASWKDKATAALAAGRELRLRDLRPIVTSARTVILDEEGKGQLKELQGILTAKVETLKVEWEAKLEKAISEGDAVGALQLAARPPEFRMQVAADKAAAVAALASAALSATTPASEWVQLLRSVAEVPMHRLVKPVGIPDDELCRTEAVKFAGSVPALASMLGMKVPPPPPPVARRPQRPSKPGPRS